MDPRMLGWRVVAGGVLVAASLSASGGGGVLR